MAIRVAQQKGRVQPGGAREILYYSEGLNLVTNLYLVLNRCGLWQGVIR